MCIAEYRLRRTLGSVFHKAPRMCFEIYWNLVLGHSPRSFLLHWRETWTALPVVVAVVVVVVAAAAAEPLSLLTLNRFPAPKLRRFPAAACCHSFPRYAQAS